MRPPSGRDRDEAQERDFEAQMPAPGATEHCIEQHGCDRAGIEHPVPAVAHDPRLDIEPEHRRDQRGERGDAAGIAAASDRIPAATPQRAGQAAASARANNGAPSSTIAAANCTSRAATSAGSNPSIMA